MIPYIRRIPVAYFPDTLMDSTEKSMLTDVGRNEYFDAFTMGTQFLIPDDLFKVLSVERIGPCIIERSFLEIAGSTRLLPISVKICGDGKADVLLTKNGISEFLAQVNGIKQRIMYPSFIQDRMLQFAAFMLNKIDPYFGFDDGYAAMTSEWCDMHNDGPLFIGRPVQVDKLHGFTAEVDQPAFVGRQLSSFNAGAMLRELYSHLYGHYTNEEYPETPYSMLMEWASPEVPDDYREIALDSLTKSSGISSDLSKTELTKSLKTSVERTRDLCSFGNIDGFYKVERMTSEILALTTFVHELPFAEFSFSYGFKQSKEPGLHWESKVLYDKEMTCSDQSIVTKLEAITSSWNPKVTDIAIAKNRDDEMLLVIKEGKLAYRYFIDLTISSVLSQALTYKDI